MNRADGIDKTLDIAASFGQIDGAHHKAWVIDQMVRALTGDDYREWVAEWYEWDEGSPP